MKILVPMKRVADPDNANKVRIASDGKSVTSDGLEWKPNPFDEYAVESALRMLETTAGGDLRGEVIVVSIGQSDASQQIRQCLAMGADRGIWVDAKDDAIDSMVVARTLAAIAKKESVDLVLMGKQAVDGDSNQVAQILAELLDWPQVTFASQIDVDANLSTMTISREVDGGSARVAVGFPAVVSVDLRIVSPIGVLNHVTPADKPYADGPRYASLRGVMKSKKKPIDGLTFAALGVDATPSVNTLSFSAPASRTAGVRLETVQELVDKLKNVAKVL